MKLLLPVSLFAAVALTACSYGPQWGEGVSKKKSTITPANPACSTLDDEAVCLARSDCEGRYAGLCPMCTPGTACPPCTDSSFIGCQDRQPVDPCAGLGETQCLANSACEAHYYAVASVCDDPAGSCAGGFMSCSVKSQPTDPCTGLSELQCTSNPLCHANYDTSTCTCPAGTACLPCQVNYLSCSPNLPPQDPCVGLDQATCQMKEPFCQPQYAYLATCPDTDAGPGLCDPISQYVGCVGGARTCESNCDCNVNEYCQVQYVSAEVFSPDGGPVRCNVPQQVGICTPAPSTIPPVDPWPVPVSDGGWAWQDGGVFYP